MFFQHARKKFLAAALSFVLGASISFSVSPVPETEAFSLGDVVGGAINAATEREKIKQQLKYYNEDENGRTELFNSFKEKYGVNDHYYLNQRLNTIMTNLANAVAQIDPSINERPYKHFINQDNGINAACAMGHVMMVNTGTFSHMVNDDEIAAIIGHEMGHGQKDHVYKSQLSKFDKTLLASVAVGAEGGSFLGKLVGSLALHQSVVHGNKRHEWEADNLAFDYMLRTNYNPGACAAVMQRFMEIMGTQKQSKADMLLNPSDHPNTEARRDNYVKKLYEYSGKHITAKDGTVFVNGEEFATIAPADKMSGEERSYFVMGNLAAAFHNGHDKSPAHVENGTLLLGKQPIIKPAPGDESAQILCDRLNAVRDKVANGKKNKKDKKAKKEVTDNAKK